MYSHLPNLILGFHGCDQSTFDAVVKHGEGLRPSVNDYDWLGNGIYFWEQNYERAHSWAEEQSLRGKFQQPAVIGAVIDLGFCLNLMDSRYIELLKNEYDLLCVDAELGGIELPKNQGSTQDKLLRRLDCAVIEHLHARIDSLPKSKNFKPFDSARGLFTEGGPAYEGAGFTNQAHIQICVRNPNCIKGYFAPREENREWRMP